MVKVFNNIYFEHLAPLRAPGRRRGPQRAGRSPATTPTPRRPSPRFLDGIGYDAVDAGPLAEGWRFQRDTAAYAVPYGAPDNVRDPRPASADEIGAKLAEAVRYRDMAS